MSYLSVLCFETKLKGNNSIRLQQLLNSHVKNLKCLIDFRQLLCVLNPSFMLAILFITFFNFLFISLLCIRKHFANQKWLKRQMQAYPTHSTISLGAVWNKNVVSPKIYHEICHVLKEKHPIDLVCNTNSYIHSGWILITRGSNSRTFITGLV